MVKQISAVLLNTEKNFCKLLLHRELLIAYRNAKCYPKGFNIIFNLSLSTNNPDLQKYCKTMLSRASNSILSHVLKEVNKDLHRLKNNVKTFRYNYCTTFQVKTVKQHTLQYVTKSDICQNQ